METTFTPGEAKALAGALAGAVSRDRARINLQGVHVSGERFAATDGYVLHTVTVPDMAAEPVTVDGKALCDALKGAAKAAGRTGTVVLAGVGGDVTVSAVLPGSPAAVFVAAVPVLAVEFPNIDTLLTADTDAEPGATFDAGRLAGIIDAAGCIGSGGRVRIDSLSVKRAAVVTAQGERFGFFGRVMPYRV